MFGRCNELFKFNVWGFYCFVGCVKVGNWKVWRKFGSIVIEKTEFSHRENESSK